jgi:hypothetical protein
MFDLLAIGEVDDCAVSRSWSGDACMDDCDTADVFAMEELVALFCSDMASDGVGGSYGSYAEPINTRLPSPNSLIWGAKEEVCRSGEYCPRNTTTPLKCVIGATCTVSASPEIALTPDQFDVIESEVMDPKKHNGSLAYNISLSARPTKPVRVTVVPVIRQASCYGHISKFGLLESVFEFTPSTYNINQTVIIVVNSLNALEYQGVFSAVFQHVVDTEDEDFKSAFLRPVSVTLQDDSTCVDGSQKYEDNKRVRKCGCRAGFYVQAVDPLFCDSAIECLECPHGMDCGFQQDHTRANITGAYYRLDNSSLNVVKCPFPDACVGNGTAGDALCADGYKGPFCMICGINATHRHNWNGEKCELCNPTSEMTVYIIVGLLGVLCVASVAYIARARKKKKSLKRRTWFNNERMEAFAEKFQTKYKILITFTQILSKITTLYPIGLFSRS